MRRRPSHRMWSWKAPISSFARLFDSTNLAPDTMTSPPLHGAYRAGARSARRKMAENGGRQSGALL